MPRTTRTEIDLELALTICAAARQAAADADALVSVAVVDAGGHLLAFQRMDGAEIAGTRRSTGKSRASAAVSRGIICASSLGARCMR